MMVDHNHVLCSTMGIKYKNNQRRILPDMFRSIFEWCADDNSRDTMLKSVSI